jgi:hypothetical protein
LKVMAFLAKSPEVSTAELIEHYEQHHVPLITSLAPAPLVYRRNYLRRAADAGTQDDFDIVTELVFQDRRAYESWVATMYAPNSGVAADEATFLDRSRTRSYIVEEHTTSA